MARSKDHLKRQATGFNNFQIFKQTVKLTTVSFEICWEVKYGFKRLLDDGNALTDTNLRLWPMLQDQLMGSRQVIGMGMGLQI